MGINGRGVRVAWGWWWGGEFTKVGQTADETHIFKVEEGERGDRSR